MTSWLLYRLVAKSSHQWKITALWNLFYVILVQWKWQRKWQSIKALLQTRRVTSLMSWHWGQIHHMYHLAGTQIKCITGELMKHKDNSAGKSLRQRLLHTQVKRRLSVFWELQYVLICLMLWLWVWAPLRSFYYLEEVQSKLMTEKESHNHPLCSFSKKHFLCGAAWRKSAFWGSITDSDVTSLCHMLLAAAEILKKIWKHDFFPPPVFMSL